jgi:hypothetical protein
MKYDDETKSNLDFVLNKIKELKKQEKNKNEESNS